MRTFDEIYESARDKPAFSNGTEGMAFMSAWCDRCVHDTLARQDKFNPDGSYGCPIIAVTMLDRTPMEFLEQPPHENGFSLYEPYHCIEFRDEDDLGGHEPRPIPDPPGQETLLPREPYEGVRTLTTEPVEVNA